MRLNRARALGAALLLVVSVAAEGAQIAVRRYTVEDGLANSFVTVIYQDSRGYLWLGTRDGLSRFDGERFVNYGAAAGLPTGNVRAVVEDSGQRLWVATWEGGLSRLIDEPGDRPAQNPRHRFVNYKLPGPREANAISALVADLDGSLLALTYGGLFRVRLAGDRLDAQRIADVNHRGGVLRAFVDRRGRRWFMTDREILLMDGGQVRRFVEPVGIGEAWIVGIAESQAGRILAANIHHLFEFTGDAGPSAWRRIDLAMAPREEFRSLVVDARNQLWAGTTRGLFKGGADEVTGPGRVATLDVTVETLFEDRRRNLWIGTDSAGAWLIPPERMLTYQGPDGLPSSNVSRIQEAADGRIFAVTGKGIAAIEGDRADPLPTPPGVTLDEAVPHARLDRHGTWWIGDKRGIWRIPDPRLRARPDLAVPLDPSMTSTGIGATTFEDSAGHVWFGDAHDRVYRIDDPRAVTMRPVPVVFSRDSKMWAVGEIAEQPAGQLWMSSSGRVARLTGGGISIVELGMAQPRALFADSRGWLWIGTRADGVLVTRNSGAAAPAFERYGVEQGLASNSVVAIAEDASGRIYLGTSRGLNRLDVATGRVRHYGTKDGLAGPRVTDCLRDRAGRIWISTSTGLSLLVPEPPSTHADPGQVLFTRVRAGGEDLAISERGTSRLPGLSLDPARPELTVEVVVPGTRGLRYEYRLRDSEDRWSPVPDDRLLTLPRLSSGQYSLSVRAASSDGDSYGAPATLRFEVLRPLWARWWFIASASGVAGLVLFGAHRLRVRQILAVERIRRQVALDLHDEMGAGLAQIAVLNEVAKRDAVGAVSGLLTESAGVARELRESMSDIVWAVDPRRDTLADLVQRMRQAAFDVLQRQGLRVSFSAPDDRVLAGVALAPDRRKHLLLMLKEAITNIARHAGASSVDIALSLEHKRIRLRVADDGRGFDPAVASDGNGLRSFQTRAAEIGGEATVRSSPGAGTTLDVTAPLA